MAHKSGGPGGVSDTLRRPSEAIICDELETTTIPSVLDTVMGAINSAALAARARAETGDTI
jgi:hypothetical protein